LRTLKHLQQAYNNWIRTNIHYEFMKQYDISLKSIRDPAVFLLKSLQLVKLRITHMPINASFNFGWSLNVLHPVLKANNVYCLVPKHLFPNSKRKLANFSVFIIQVLKSPCCYCWIQPTPLSPTLPDFLAYQHHNL
jgi:hypothetical protein